MAVISGGRPALKQRVTARNLPSLVAAGLSDVEWVVRSDQVDGYERDDHPVNVYPVDWADRYAREHWRHPSAVFVPGGFHGAFPGREWVMRSAETRGFDAVLQLDDNILNLGLINSQRPALRAGLSAGAMCALLVEFAASTNVAMCGAQLSQVPPTRLKTIRPGFPYSAFVEKTGPGRLPYHGPFEDDIMQAMEYGLHGGPARTTGVVEAMKYSKEYTSGSGMRRHYDATRGLEIARRYPANVTLKITRRTSSPRDRSRGVRHLLTTRGFTPVRVTDRDRFLAAEHELWAAVDRALALQRQSDRDKIRQRSERE